VRRRGIDRCNDFTVSEEPAARRQTLVEPVRSRPAGLQLEPTQNVAPDKAPGTCPTQQHSRHRRAVVRGSSVRSAGFPHHRSGESVFVIDRFRLPIHRRGRRRVLFAALDLAESPDVVAVFEITAHPPSMPQRRPADPHNCEAGRRPACHVSEPVPEPAIGYKPDPVQ